VEVTIPIPLQILQQIRTTFALVPYSEIKLHRLPVEYYQQFEDIPKLMVVFLQTGSWRLTVYSMDGMKQSYLINRLFSWIFESAVILFGLERDQVSWVAMLIQSASMQDPCELKS
jgi:hypothetical protein